MEFQIERWKEIYEPNPAMLRLTLTRQGFRVFQWCDRPETGYSNHKHNEDQTHWIISGALEITISNVGSYTLEAGDRDFIPANTYHSAQVIGEEPVIYLVGAKI